MTFESADSLLAVECACYSASRDLGDVFARLSRVGNDDTLGIRESALARQLAAQASAALAATEEILAGLAPLTTTASLACGVAEERYATTGAEPGPDELPW